MVAKNFNIKVYKAQRFNVKASIMIEGLTGSGKTGLALALAKVLAGDWESVGVTDTENRSTNLYEGMKLHTGDKVAPFLKIDLTKDDGYAPLNYLACTDALMQAGAKAVVLDSVTHAWQREGGVLDLVNKLESKKNGNKFRAWGDPEVVDNKNAIFDMLRNENVHLISTVRVKEKFGLEMDSTTNRNTVVSLGEQQQTQEGVKYEPDLVLHMERPGTASTPPRVSVVKSRYPMLEKDAEYDMTPELMMQIKNYLEEGADPEVLIEEQRQEYVQGIKEYCKGDQMRMQVYKQLKANAGLENVKLEDMEIKMIKALYVTLTED